MGELRSLAARVEALRRPGRAEDRAALLAEARPALLWSHAGGGGPFDRLMVELGRRADAEIAVSSSSNS